MFYDAKTKRETDLSMKNVYSKRQHAQWYYRELTLNSTVIG